MIEKPYALSKKSSRPVPSTWPGSVSVELLPSPQGDGDAVLRIEARVETHWRTGVEMEALVAASVAGLTVYDMCKAVDRGMSLESVRLVEKRGGKSGTWSRPGEPR